MRHSAPERHVSRSCSYAGRPQRNLVEAPSETRRPSEMRKPRLVVDVQNQLLTKTVVRNPASEGIRQVSAANKQTTCAPLPAKRRLFKRCLSAAAASTCHASNHTTTAHRRGAHPEPTSPEPENARPAWRCLGGKKTSAPRFLARV